VHELVVSHADHADHRRGVGNVRPDSKAILMRFVGDRGKERIRNARQLAADICVWNEIGDHLQRADTAVRGLTHIRPRLTFIADLAESCAAARVVATHRYAWMAAGSRKWWPHEDEPRTDDFATLEQVTELGALRHSATGGADCGHTMAQICR
jgi:hypothetical protein